MAGGDQNGWNQRLATYNPNNLNQYTQRTVPGAVDIMGLSLATNVVTVNSTTAYRKGEYFRQHVTVNNTNVPAWEGINVSAGPASVSGNQFVPKTPEVFLYDKDGNLTNDGHWAYIWDGENRLVQMVANNTVAPAQLITFAYDYKGWRISKTVWSNTTGYGNPATSLAFVYDGWNLVTELNTLNAPMLLRSYVWGSDLSGSPQGAGGVGGLLGLTYHGAQTTNCFASSDGNGNLASLVNVTDATLAAQYEYGPFAEFLRTTGPMAKANPFRFSAKYQDDETDLLYYGYRYHDTGTGRWVSRDPIREKGGANLYCFVLNAPIGSADVLGQIKVSTLTSPDKLTSTCGSVEDVRWDFTLDKSAPQEGYIVQEVTIEVPNDDCGIVNGDFGEPVYWEAWFVHKGDSIQSAEGKYHYTDQAIEPAHVGTKGQGKFLGEIKCFFKTRTLDLGEPGTEPPTPPTAPGWELRHSTLTSGILPPTRIEPTWWDDPPDAEEKPARRSVNTTWDCCCKDAYSRIVVAPGFIIK